MIKLDGFSFNPKYVTTITLGTETSCVITVANDNDNGGCSTYAVGLSREQVSEKILQWYIATNELLHPNTYTRIDAKRSLYRLAGLPLPGEPLI